LSPTPQALSRLLRRYDQPVRDLTVRLRRVVLREMAPCHEYIYDAGSALALWYSFTSRVMDGACFIGVYTKHVNLGFNRGAMLPDPHRLLKGTGKWMRHITMKTPADIARPVIRDYLQSAIAETNDDPVPGEQRPKLRGVVTTVRRKNRVSPIPARRALNASIPAEHETSGSRRRRAQDRHPFALRPIGR
jgi:hypothetical protein